MPLDDLPEHFAIRPAWGTGTRGTHVVSGTTDIVTGVTYKDRKSLRDVVLKERGRFGAYPLVAEEFMTTPTLPRTKSTSTYLEPQRIISTRTKQYKRICFGIDLTGWLLRQVTA
jgi:hypothetical protein